jgi:hypothetical protein
MDAPSDDGLRSHGHTIAYHALRGVGDDVDHVGHEHGRELDGVLRTTY